MSNYYFRLAEAILTDKNDQLAKDVIAFCEHNNIDIENLNQEKVEEVFGFVKAMGSAIKSGVGAAKRAYKDSRSQAVINRQKAAEKAAASAQGYAAKRKAASELDKAGDARQADYVARYGRG